MSWPWHIFVMPWLLILDTYNAGMVEVLVQCPIGIPSTLSPNSGIETEPLYANPSTLNYNTEVSKVLMVNTSVVVRD